MINLVVGELTLTRIFEESRKAIASKSAVKTVNVLRQYYFTNKRGNFPLLFFSQQTQSIDVPYFKNRFSNSFLKTINNTSEMRAFFSLVKKRSNYFPVSYVKIHSSYSMQDLRRLVLSETSISEFYSESCQKSIKGLLRKLLIAQKQVKALNYF